jgi:hypothetical protein
MIDKAEMTLVTLLHGKIRSEKRALCKKLGVPWGEYQRLKRKYSRLLGRYDEELRKE